MKKYLPLIEAINAICWFWFDFSWMQDWNLSAQVGSILSMATGMLLFCISWSWSSGALMNWIIMNSCWMNNQNSWGLIFGIIGFAMILISIVEDGNIRDFIRLKIKTNQKNRK